MKQDEIKDIKYWKSNAEEDYMMKVPISVLRYITELENLLPPQVVQSEVSEKQIDSFISDIWVYLSDDFDKADRFYFKKCVNDFINSLTPPDAEKEAVMFAEWIYKNYISNGIGKYYHNNWNGDLDTLVNYTTQELFNLYKQGGK